MLRFHVSHKPASPPSAVEQRSRNSPLRISSSCRAVRPKPRLGGTPSIFGDARRVSQAGPPQRHELPETHGNAPLLRFRVSHEPAPTPSAVEQQSRSAPHRDGPAKERLPQLADRPLTEPSRSGVSSFNLTPAAKAVSSLALRCKGPLCSVFFGYRARLSPTRRRKLVRCDLRIECRPSTGTVA